MHRLLLYFAVFLKNSYSDKLSLLQFPNKPTCLVERKAWLTSVTLVGTWGPVSATCSLAFVVSMVGGPSLMFPLIAAHKEIQPVHPKGNQP